MEELTLEEEEEAWKASGDGETTLGITAMFLINPNK